MTRAAGEPLLRRSVPEGSRRLPRLASVVALETVDVVAQESHFLRERPVALLERRDGDRQLDADHEKDGDSDGEDEIDRLLDVQSPLSWVARVSLRGLYGCDLG